MQTKIITQNKAMKNLLNSFIHNENIRNNKETLIILLQGDTGTGKEVFAREIHNSSKAKGKFVAINCAAIPDGLFASHWFGHRKGSFSGAIEDRKGAFEEAKNGTLFLDEIGEIPLDFQAILLRALQENKGFRVGEMDK
jgi:transcriptional regulator with PAS, ATPase and Fis domain